MKALVLNSYSEPLQLETVPNPVTGPGEVLVKVKSSGLNPLDLKIMVGQAAHAQTRLPAIIGIDVSGVVESVGEGVTNFKKGDEVYGMIGGVGNNPGSLAEYVAVDAELIALKPKNLSFHDSAALPLVFITAWEGIVDRANVHSGQKVLIHGGSGGVGHLAVQIAKARGAEVYATVSEDKFDLISGYGATPINYQTATLEEYVAKYTGGEGFDIVMDNVGGAVLDSSFKAAKRYTGHVISILGWGNHSLAPLSFRGATYSGVFTLHPLLSKSDRAHHGEILRFATEMVERGQVIPLVSPQVYHLEETVKAYGDLASGARDGKIVVDVA
jgi:NADPH2:quinone reductase